MEIKKEEEVYKDFLRIRKRTLVAPDGSTFERESLMRNEATAVLVYNEDTKKIIFTKQYRDAVDGISLEIPAGLMDDDDEEPRECAIREVLEETGYGINKLDLIPLIIIEPAPGYTNEKIHIFMVVVNNEMKVSEGGGLDIENEYIELVEYGVSESYELMLDNTLTDAKSIIALQFFKMKEIQ